MDDETGSVDELHSNQTITPQQEDHDVDSGEEDCNLNTDEEDHDLNTGDGDCNANACDYHNINTHEENCNTDTSTLKRIINTPQNGASLHEDTSHPSTSCTKCKCLNLMVESEFAPKKAWRGKISGKYNIVVVIF